jgi:hypothetical protein
MSLRLGQECCHLLNIIFLLPIKHCFFRFLNDWKVKIWIPVVIRGRSGKRHGFFS